jgi:hypothetical protein
MQPQAKTIAAQNNRCDCLQLAVSRASKLLERNSMGSHQPSPIAHRYASVAPANAELPAESALFALPAMRARAARLRSAPSTELTNRRSRKPPAQEQLPCRRLVPSVRHLVDSWRATLLQTTLCQRVVRSGRGLFSAADVTGICLWNELHFEKLLFYAIPKAGTRSAFMC